MNQAEFDAVVTAGQNDAAQESALDMLNRAMKFAEDLQKLTSAQELPGIIIDGVLLSNISVRSHRTIRVAQGVVNDDRL